MWLEDGESKSLSYADYARMTNNYAAYIRKHIDTEPDSYVVISMDTCKEWFPTFWGIIQAGYNALLVDVNLSDDMVEYLVRQSGAKAYISTVKRPLDKSILYIEAAQLFQAPDVDPIENDSWGDHVALCTSGTTGTSRIFEYDGAAIVEQVLSSEILSHNLKRAVTNRCLARVRVFTVSPRLRLSGQPDVGLVFRILQYLSSKPDTPGYSGYRADVPAAPVNRGAFGCQ